MESGVKLEIRVDRGIEESELLAGWIGEESRAFLARGHDQSGTLSIAVRGALYEYAVTIEARRGGDAVGTPDTWACECSNEELLEQIESRLSGASDQLTRSRATERLGSGSGSGSSNAVQSRTMSSEAEATEAHKRRSLGASTKTGIVMMAFGAAGLATGATLVGIGQRNVANDRAPTRTSTRDYEAPGTIAAVAGGGLLVLGVGLVLAGRLSKTTRPRRRNIALPAIGPDGSMTLTLTGRF